MKIDIERLGVLLDRGADVVSAAGQARKDLSEAEAALRGHDGDDTAHTALASRVERRRTAHQTLASRAAVWSEYCGALRTLAKQHGVEL